MRVPTSFHATFLALLLTALEMARLCAQPAAADAASLLQPDLLSLLKSDALVHPAQLHRHIGVEEVIAFEEHAHFVYLAGKNPSVHAASLERPPVGPRVLRRHIFGLGPDRALVLDQVPDRARNTVWHWTLAGSAENPGPAQALVHFEKNTGLATIELDEKIFRIRFSIEEFRPGHIEVVSAEGKQLLERRLLPEGILPHGPEGRQLLQRWDSAYHDGNQPAWDTGRPSSELGRALTAGALPSGRALELGCGTGTSSIFLARQGYEVTAIDIAPTALRIAQEKANEAGVEARWVLADVVAPPALEPFDLIFDRGCYHGVRRQNASGYVETIRRLTRPGSKVLILAGNANEPPPHYGPPRVREEAVRKDFADGFEIEWLREVRFDTRDPDRPGALAWSILLRRTE